MMDVHLLEILEKAGDRLAKLTVKLRDSPVVPTQYAEEAASGVTYVVLVADEVRTRLGLNDDDGDQSGEGE